MTIDITPLISGRVETFALLLVRVTTLLLVLPIFGNRVMPFRIRVLAGVALAVALLPTVPVLPIARGAGALEFALLVGREVLFGLVLGLIASIGFFGVLFAGQVVGIQMGFGIVNVIDPQSDTQVAVTAEFQNLLFLLVFLTLDGHHLLIAALVKTVERVPLGAFSLDGRMIDLVARQTGDVFAIALRVGAPIVAFLFVTSLALGIVAKTAPQLNVFNLGFPVQIVGGLVVMLLALPTLRVVFEELTLGMERNLLAAIAAR